MIACIFAPKRHRKKIALAMALGIVGGIYVTDTHFIQRISTITTETEQLDVSATSRLRLWKAGYDMLMDHPLGIGIGNWYQTIGDYIPEYERKDSHNTYVKCAAEMGIFGIIVYFSLLLAVYVQLRKVRKLAEYLPQPEQEDLILFSFALTVSLAVILACGLTITMIYTEIVWIIMMLSVCLGRSLDNAFHDYGIEVDANKVVSKENSFATSREGNGSEGTA